MAYSKDVEAFASQHKRHTEHLLVAEFPAKVRRLDELLRAEEFADDTLGRLMHETAAVRPDKPHDSPEKKKNTHTHTHTTV